MSKIPIGWLAYNPGQGDRSGQIYRALRERILSGDPPRGARLPSSRALAAALGVGRTTVTSAYERLAAEGFLVASRGAASRVADLQPAARVMHPTPALPTVAPPLQVTFRLKPGNPDVTHFPHRLWARCLTSRSRSLRLHDLGYGEAAGLAELRGAIAEHLAAGRGVSATADEVIIVPSASAAMALVARTVLNPSGRIVWIEDPGYPTAREVLAASGGEIRPIAVDGDGLNIPGNAEAPNLIYVTPSHQYPMGVTMSLPRRLALIEAARASGAFIIEDDYDSDFVDASPIAALRSIDRAGVVIYVGTFSKVLAPGLRVAYAIAPRPLIAGMLAQQRMIGAFVSIHVQAALFDFIEYGHYRAHLRRMRDVYRGHCEGLVAAIRQHCGSLVRLEHLRGGLQIPVWFQDQTIDDRQVAARMSSAGFGIEALSDMYLGVSKRGILVGVAQATDYADDMARLLGETLVALANRRAEPLKKSAAE